jgi:chromosomal replication initiation ATPase DnaA
MEQKILLSHLYLTVGQLYVPELDKRVALERCKRGVVILGVKWEDVIIKGRRGEICDARHMCSKYLRDCGFGYKAISKILGRGDHSTSVYSVRRGNELYDVDRNFRHKYHRFLNA